MHIKVLQIVQLIYTKNSLLLVQSEHTEIYRDNFNSHYHGKMFSEIRKESLTCQVLGAISQRMRNRAQVFGGGDFFGVIYLLIR